MKRAAVIGAGAGGLSTAKHLLQRGIAVTLFEIGSRVGGLWVYDSDSGRSPAYRSLHLNSENKVTAYKDFAFPEGTPLYADHTQVTAYLQAYAESFGILPHIRFRSRVVSVARDGATWRLTLEDGAQHGFDFVVIASGHQGVPKHPPFAPDFTGEYLHSHTYRTPEGFAGKRVLVVGVGNSACDIAADISPFTQSTTIAARSPVLMMPRMFLGVPTSRVLARIERRWMPWALRRRIRETISAMAHGRMEQWGFSTPKTRTHPAGHHLLMSQFVWGRVTAKPGVAGVSGREVRFSDGSTDSYDVMIAATGYEVDLPFLAPELSPVSGQWLDLYHRVVRPGQPQLYFVGFFNVTGGGNIRMMDDQAAWVAAIETGEVALPGAAEMQRAILAERAVIKRLYPDSPRYGLELDPPAYRRALARELRQGRARVARPAE